MADMIITIDDMRGAGFCATGIYGILLSHGWSREQFRQFIEFGVPLSELQGQGHDALLDRVVAFKEGQTNGG